MAPNALTVFRLVLTPAILALAYSSRPGPLSLGLGLFVVAIFTDWLDGRLARVRNQITTFGTVMDPVVDKVLMLGALVVLSDRGLVPVWVVLVVLSREFLVMGTRNFRAAEGVVVGANWMGKTKLAMQAAVVMLGYTELILEADDRLLLQGVRATAVASGAMAVVSVIFALRFVQAQFFGKPSGS